MGGLRQQWTRGCGRADAIQHHEFGNVGPIFAGRRQSPPCRPIPYTADNIINFIRGDEIPGLRTRMVEVPLGSGTYKVWKLGDPIHSTPTIVAAPRSNYDLIYGDATYTAFYTRWQNRREVIYVGANDGMLHAFNGGYYNKSDDPCTTTVTEHGYFTKMYFAPTAPCPKVDSGRALGDELWGFIPYQLLPQLQWLTRADYTHVYYVDLKPTVTDVRIFTPDADHPNGWGTVLIGDSAWEGAVQTVRWARAPSNDGQYRRDEPQLLQCVLCARYHQSGGRS